MDMTTSVIAAADIEEWEAETKQRANEAREAIQRYQRTLDQCHQQAALEAIRYYSCAQSSERRLLPVLSLIESAPPEIFWRALMSEWNTCDATWDHRARLLQAMLNAAKPSMDFLALAHREFFETLARQVQVFRGCSAPRVRSVAWTTNRAVAVGFARGHRRIRVPDPVVATAVIPKEHIFLVTNDRKENEIVLNPRRLRKLIVEPLKDS
jgi:hypothetical protein